MIVLDTHVLLWLDRGDAALGRKARTLIDEAWNAGIEVGVSAISFWECAMLALRGRIAFSGAVDAWRADLLGAGVVEWPLDGRVALLATTLENLHRDPADRFIAATALLKSATLITADQKLLDWPSPLNRHDARQ